MAFWRLKKRNDQEAPTRVSRGSATGRKTSANRSRQSKSLGGMVDLLETTLAEGAKSKKVVSRKR